MDNESKRPWEQKLEGAGVRAEAELRRVITYVNDEVVPEVRRDGSKALRAAAEELRRLAEKMEGHPAPTPPAGAGGERGTRGDVG